MTTTSNDKKKHVFMFDQIFNILQPYVQHCSTNFNHVKRISWDGPHDIPSPGGPWRLQEKDPICDKEQPGGRCEGPPTGQGGVWPVDGGFMALGCTHDIYLYMYIFMCIYIYIYVYIYICIYTYNYDQWRIYIYIYVFYIYIYWWICVWDFSNKPSSYWWVPPF